jgi:nuclease S1
MRVMHQGIVLGCVVLLSALFVPEVEAWGDMGHAIICEIAFQELNPPAREAVQRLIQQDPDFRLFSKACAWPDHPRKRAGEHFVNLPRSATGLGDNPCPVWTPRVW